MTSRSHDALFKSGFEVPAGAAALLRGLLPTAVGDAISWDTLRCERGLFIGPEFADHHNDLLFRAHLRAGRPECIFILLEHQSTVDPSMPQRMATYQLQIWNRFRREQRRSRCRQRRKDPLPPVLAVLVSHARGGWTAPRSFESLFDPAVMAIPGLAPLVPCCSMVVLDLVHLTNADLQALSLPAFQKLVLWLLRDARAPARLLSNFDAWIPLMLEAGQARTGLDSLQMLSHYMYDVVDPKIRAQLVARLHSSSVLTKEAAMTIADMIHEEGRVDALRRQLAIKFGTLDATSEARLQTATPKAIDGYLGRVLTADSLAEVFEGRARRRAPRPRARGSRPVHHRRAQPRRRRW